MQQPATKIKLEPFQQFILDCLEKNEDGDARLYCHINRDKFCYDQTENHWYEWRGHYWEKDRTDRHGAAIYDIVQLYEDEAIRQADNEIKATEIGDGQTAKQASTNYKNLLRRIQALRAISRKKHVIELSTWGDAGLSISGEEWDQERYQLACQNGIVDLRTGELSNGNQKQFHRTPCPISYNPNADAPELFIKFLNDIFDGNWDLVKYLKRLFGYSLIGQVVEHILPIFYGSGRNGKDTLIQTVSHVLGSVAKPIDVELLLDKKLYRSSANASPDIVNLWGRRIVWASETNQTRKLNAGMVKLLTGGNILTGRPLYANDYVTFHPTHTPILITNHKPHAPASDYALWQRIHLTPFEVAFVDEPKQKNERQRDPHLPDRLKTENTEIFKWLVDGCLEYQKEGLNPPDCVKQATDQYRHDEDTIGQFIDQKCEISENSEIKASDLYKAYREWCDENGFHSLNQKNFGYEIKSRFDSYKPKAVYYIGLRLSDSSDSCDSFLVKFPREK